RAQTLERDVVDPRCAVAPGPCPAIESKGSAVSGRSGDHQIAGANPFDAADAPLLQFQTDRRPEFRRPAVQQVFRIFQENDQGTLLPNRIPQADEQLAIRRRREPLDAAAASTLLRPSPC